MDRQSYNRNKFIEDGYRFMIKKAKTFIRRADNVRTEHKIQKKVMKWANTSLPRWLPKEERLAIANGITGKLLTANSGYNAYQRKILAARKRKEAEQPPSEVIAQIGNKEIKVK